MTLKKLVALFDKKRPGLRREPARLRKRPTWMREDHAQVLASFGADTLLGLFHGRVLSKEECVASRDLFTSVDEQGDWFGATWQPFLADATGAVMCIDRENGSVIYYDKGADPQLVARSVAGYLKLVERVLRKLPTPPPEEEDDIVEEELDEAFELALRKATRAVMKPAPRPKPRKDVPPKPPPPDLRVPKAIIMVARFTATKAALPGLTVARGVGMDLGGGYAISSIGMRGACWSITFRHRAGAYTQAKVLIVILDPRAKDAFVTFDDGPARDVFLAKARGGLRKMGFKLVFFPPGKIPPRIAQRWGNFLASFSSI